MSYSRWSNSDFYTYWASSRGSGKEDQVFMLHLDLVSTYELTYKDVQVYLLDKRAFQERFGLRGYEADELLGYMGQFVADVDKKFREDRKGAP